MVGIGIEQREPGVWDGGRPEAAQLREAGGDGGTDPGRTERKVPLAGPEVGAHDGDDRSRVWRQGRSQ